MHGLFTVGRTPSLVARPLAVGEHLLGAGGEASLFAADMAYGREKDWAYAAELFGHALDRYRLHGVDHVAPMVFQSSRDGKSVPNPYLSALAYPLRNEGVFFRDLSTNWWSGETVRVRLVAFNETLREREYRVSWRLTGLPFEDSGEWRLRLAPSQVRTVEIRTCVPETASSATGSLVGATRPRRRNRGLGGVGFRGARPRAGVGHDLARGVLRPRWRDPGGPAPARG